MHSRSLRTLGTLFMFFAVSSACTPVDPGTSDTSTGDASTGGASTGGSTGVVTGGSTGEATAPTTSGASDSATGSTGEGSSSGASTGTVEETGSTGDASSTGQGSSTGEPVVPISFDECREGDNGMCPAEDPACLVVDGPGGGDPNGSFFVTWSYCTRECDVDADCVSGPMGGTAKPLCVPKGPNQVKVCVLDCSFGKKCPDSLECANDDTCGTRYCDCMGTGCQEKLCTG